MTSLEIAKTGRVLARHKESPLGLLIATINEMPDSSERSHKTAFKKLVREPGYEDFIDSIIDEWQAIKYSTALRAAFPPKASEIREALAKRKVLQQETAGLVEKAGILIGSRLLDMIMPNGKMLRNCTGDYCAKTGGFLAKIGSKIGPAEIVGRALSESELQKLLCEKLR